MQNALALKKRVGVPLVAVVKNDAYGHGLVRVANVLRDVVDGFAVATVDEALKIADTGVETMILLPCLTEAELTVASKRGFVVTLSDFPSLSLAERCGLPLAVQIKVDSGNAIILFNQVHNFPFLVNGIGNGFLRQDMLIAPDSFLYLFFSGICQCKKTNSFYTLVIKDFLFIGYDSG